MTSNAHLGTSHREFRSCCRAERLRRVAAGAHSGTNGGHAGGRFSGVVVGAYPDAYRWRPDGRLAHLPVGI